MMYATARRLGRALALLVPLVVASCDLAPAMAGQGEPPCYQQHCKQ